MEEVGSTGFIREIREKVYGLEDSSKGLLGFAEETSARLFGTSLPINEAEEELPQKTKGDLQAIFIAIANISSHIVSIENFIAKI